MHPHASAQVPRRSLGRRRAMVLIAVHLLIAIHIATWLIWGRTVSPLELNETMFTLELGIVTIGAIFMALIVISTLIFGRFFCSWGCHVLALQDLTHWALGRCGLRPKPVRSRLLLLGPVAVMLLMFVWPQIARLWSGQPRPTLHLSTDADGFGSLMTTDFLRNLPGPGITVLTFVVCGGLIVYLLGSRSFCRYVCPYGAIFALTDRFAPGRIRLDPDAACTQCGQCTAACDSDIRVHQEIAVFGQVVNPACLKDLDCVTACPTQALHWGLTRPALWRSWSASSRPGRYDFSWGEELAALTVGTLTFVAFRSLYGQVPLLLAAALGVLVAWVTVLMMHLAIRRDLRLKPFQLKRAGRWTPAGVIAASAALVVLIFTLHSGIVRVHEHRGHALWRDLRAHPVPGPTAHALLRELRWIDRWGAWTPPYVNDRLARTATLLNRPELAIEPLERLARQWPENQHVQNSLAETRAALSASR